MGLADIIYNQLQDRFGSGPKAVPVMPIQGPLPIPTGKESEKKQSIPIDNEKKFLMLDTPQLPGSSQFIFQGPKEGYEVTSPWSGRVSQVFAVESGRQVIQIDHDNGMSSKLVFEGQIVDQLKGKSIEAGTKVGSVGGSVGTLSWRVTKSV